MRSPADRLRHAVLFEVMALVLITPLGAFAYSMPWKDISLVAVVSASIAMLWNIIYNYLFDRAMMRFCGTTQKSLPLRFVHTVLFEGGLLIALIPFIAWYLGVTLWLAFAMDLSFSLFYMAYAFVFNWGYDKVFPLAEWGQRAPQDTKA